MTRIHQPEVTAAVITQHFVDRQKLQEFHPFTRLRALLDKYPAGQSPLANGKPINLSIGEPQTQPPAFVAEEIAKASAGWSRYPLSKGSEDYLGASKKWLEKRYHLPETMIDSARHLLAVPGTREGLFFTALTVLPMAEPGKPAPVFLMPNPCYHVYTGAAAAAGAEVVTSVATKASGYLPDYTSLPAEILARTALCVLCSPSNPEGAVASPEKIKELILLARKYDFVVAFDECYAEIYSETPPPSALEILAEMGGDLSNVLVFHSLSKRSSAAGLRCGFIAGDEKWISMINTTCQVGGAGVPLPVQAAGTRLWQDEEHVEKNRALYQKNFSLAQKILGPVFPVEIPSGGFCLWLDVGNGVAAAETLWREAGIRVLPGAFMGHRGENGFNPGDRYIRLALVYDPELTAVALETIRNVLAPDQTATKEKTEKAPTDKIAGAL
ncbi:aminotransferase class I/II-fold pyridoxal phosphate-dependent enzyme [Kiloniella laminariae]|uniref:Aminotransferase class I/II-fold pyridoxal phosphate-dependent enzyme n=1 Tax=Kiloniella laminariae TaxID=454162 RepID=A0ABT4LJ48_9PROT|nr:aminotransferase class I/II-fold pyridoxal phosphate-dependent enzyme [Kiloniella laminariae]MCZ4281137.1 aminotransferase class I/II-fold pyridoxal phosphate-dependent enzyme [Kiloniella laminariae]